MTQYGFGVFSSDFVMSYSYVLVQAILIIFIPNLCFLTYFTNLLSNIAKILNYTSYKRKISIRCLHIKNAQIKWQVEQKILTMCLLYQTTLVTRILVTHPREEKHLHLFIPFLHDQDI